MNVPNINTETYTIAIDNTSKAATLTRNAGDRTRAIITNNSTVAAFVTSGATQPTAVFPTSATSPLLGKVIAAGETLTYELNKGDKYIAAIQPTSGTGNLYISLDS